MHLCTIVRVRAGTPEDAIAIVNDLLEDGSRYEVGIFDYFDRESTAICDDVKTETDFVKLREREIEEYHEYMKEALARADGDELKGFYLRMAGYSLSAGHFWTPQRLAYDYASEYQNESDGDVYFVVTDRHY